MPPDSPGTRAGKVTRRISPTTTRKFCVLLRILAGYIAAPIHHAFTTALQTVYTTPFGLHRLSLCARTLPCARKGLMLLNFGGSGCGEYAYRRRRDRYPRFSATPGIGAGGYAPPRTCPHSPAQPLTRTPRHTPSRTQAGCMIDVSPSARTASPSHACIHMHSIAMHQP